MFTAADRRDPGQRTSSAAHPFASTVAALGDVRELTRARELLDRVPASDEHGVPWPVYTRMAHALLVERSVGSARALDLADPLRHTTNVPVVTALTAKGYRHARHPKRAVEVSATSPACSLSRSFRRAALSPHASSGPTRRSRLLGSPPLGCPPGSGRYSPTSAPR